MFPDSDDLEKKQPEPVRYESFYHFHSRQGGFPLKTKLLLGSMIAAGIALGTFLFLFFIAIFIYIFLPIMAVLIIWNAVKQLTRK